MEKSYRFLNMNEKVTAALKNIFIYFILDVSAVYAAIFKGYNKHKWQNDENSHNHNSERCYIQGRKRRGEKQRDTSMAIEKEIDETRTHLCS